MSPKKRTINKTVRFTDEEYNFLVKKSEKAGTKFATYVRYAALNFDVKTKIRGI